VLRGLSDEDLIADYYACDDDAMDELYRRYCARLEQFFRNGGLSEEEARDKAQDVFVRVMETKYPLLGSRAQPYDPHRGTSFKTWLFRIATNLLIDVRRRQGRTVDFTSLEREGEEGEVEPFEETVPDEEPSPEERTLAKETRQDVHDCMGTLPPRERVAMALWLETNGEMKLADLADRLGVSVPTAHRVLKSAFRHMRECLESKEG
jgi:RNA polymerase sigma-70 factor (ECF subfamily)